MRFSVNGSNPAADNALQLNAPDATAARVIPRLSVGIPSQMGACSPPHPTSPLAKVGTQRRALLNADGQGITRWRCLNGFTFPTRLFIYILK